MMRLILKAKRHGVYRPGSHGGHPRVTESGKVTYKLVNGGAWKHRKTADGKNDVRSPMAGDFFRHPSGHTALALEDHPTSMSHPILDHDPSGMGGAPSTPGAVRRAPLVAPDLLAGKPSWTCRRCGTKADGRECPHCGAGGFPDEPTGVMAKAKRLAFGLFRKAVGDRGGKVLGYTRSGKPIYDRADHPEHAAFTPQDHDDAVDAHADAGIGNPGTHRHAYEAAKHQDQRDAILREDAHDGAAAALAREVVKHREMAKAATAAPKKHKPLIGKEAFQSKPQPLDGEHVLGKTKSGKAIYASGAETGDYDDQDHQDAAARHAAAHRRHQTLAELHGKVAEKDDDWQRSETHHADTARHKALADHHLELARDHLIAGGHGGSQQLGLDKDGKPTTSDLTPYTDEERQAARDALGRRTHHGHPGGLTDRDRQAYGAA